MERLENPVRHYAWGSPSAIPELLGRPGDGAPWAEMWMGAHPSAPSTALGEDGEPIALDQLIHEQAHAVLGPRVRERFGDRLPFLLKILAAGQPLSLQVHPSLEQAARGFAAEDAAGIPVDAQHRSYRDDQHKPEMVLALTPFEALSGFRDLARTAELLHKLGVQETVAWSAQLLGKGHPTERLRSVFESALAADTTTVEAVVTGCRQRLKHGSPFDREDRTVVALAEHYPGDPGVVVSLLLHRVTLGPGQAMFLDAGNVHTYLSGLALEVMAASDNVLRGGLTKKHVDVPELLRVVDFRSLDVPLVRPVTEGPLRTWRTAAEEFQLTWVEAAAGPVTVPWTGPRIVICLEETAELRAGGRSLRLGRGESAVVFDADGPLDVLGPAAAVVAAVRQPVSAINPS